MSSASGAARIARRASRPPDRRRAVRSTAASCSPARSTCACSPSRPTAAVLGRARPDRSASSSTMQPAPPCPLGPPLPPDETRTCARRLPRDAPAQAAAGRRPAAVASSRMPGSICCSAIEEMPSRMKRVGLSSAVEEAVAGFDDDAARCRGVGQRRARRCRADLPARATCRRPNRSSATPAGRPRSPAPAACAARRTPPTAAAPAPRDGRATGTAPPRAGCWPADGAA